MAVWLPLRLLPLAAWALTGCCGGGGGYAERGPAMPVATVGCPAVASFDARDEARSPAPAVPARAVAVHRVDPRDVGVNEETARLRAVVTGSPQRQAASAPAVADEVHRVSIPRLRTAPRARRPRVARLPGHQRSEPAASSPSARRRDELRVPPRSPELKVRY